MSVQPPSNPLWVKIVEALSLQFSWPGLDEDHLRAAETACNELAKMLGTVGPPIQQGGAAYAVAVLGRDGQQVQAAALDLATNGPPALQQAAKQVAAFFGSTADQVEHSKRRIVFMAVVNAALIAALTISLFFTGPGAILGATVAEQLLVRQVAEWIAEELAGLVARIAADAVSEGVEQALAKLAEFGLGTALNIATRQIPMFVAPDFLAMASEGKFDGGELAHDAEVAGLMGVFGSIVGGPFGALLSKLPAGEGQLLAQRLLIGFGRNTSHSAINAFTAPLAEQVLDPQQESLGERYRTELVPLLIGNLAFSGLAHGAELADMKLHPERVAELNERFEALNVGRAADENSTLDPAQTPDDADRSVGVEQPVGDRAAGAPVAEESAPPVTAEEPVAESPDQRDTAETVLVPTVGDGNAGRNGTDTRVVKADGVGRQRVANEGVGSPTRQVSDPTADVARSPDQPHDGDSGRAGVDWAKAIKGSDGPSSDDLARQAGFAGHPDHTSQSTGGDQGLPITGDDGTSSDQTRRQVGLDNTGDGRGSAEPPTGRTAGRTSADEPNVAGDNRAGKEQPTVGGGAADPERRSDQYPTDPPGDPTDPPPHDPPDHSSDDPHHSGDPIEAGKRAEGLRLRSRVDERLAELRAEQAGTGFWSRRARQADDLPAETLTRLMAKAIHEGDVITQLALLDHAISRVKGYDALDWTQLIGGRGLIDGTLDQAAGEGKTEAFDIASIVLALRRGAMVRETSTDVLAGRDAAALREIAGLFGVNVVLVDHYAHYAEPTTATVFVTSENEHGFYVNQHEEALPADVLRKDEVDTANPNKLFVTREGKEELADDETVDQIDWALQASRGEFDDGDFIRSPDGSWNLTEDGRRKLANALLDGHLIDSFGADPLSEAEHLLVTTRVATRDLREYDDYLDYRGPRNDERGKILIIDPDTGLPLEDPRTLVEQRWESHGGAVDLAQIVERMHGLDVHAAATSSKRTTLREVYDHYSDKGGASGTAAPHEAVLRDLGFSEVSEVPRLNPSQLTERPDSLHDTEQEAFDAVVDRILTNNCITDSSGALVLDRQGNPIYVGDRQPTQVKAHRNSWIDGPDGASPLRDALIARGVPAEKVQALGAKWIADQDHNPDITRDDALDAAFERAGEPGMITITGGFGGRGTNIKPPAEAYFHPDGSPVLKPDGTPANLKYIKAYLDGGGKLVGGLRAYSTARSATTARDDIQMKYRAARKGFPGESLFFGFFQGHGLLDAYADHTPVQELRAAYLAAREAHNVDPTPETAHALDEIGRRHAQLIRDLQDTTEYGQPRPTTELPLAAPDQHDVPIRDIAASPAQGRAPPRADPDDLTPSGNGATPHQPTHTITGPAVATNPQSTVAPGLTGPASSSITSQEQPIANQSAGPTSAVATTPQPGHIAHTINQSVQPLRAGALVVSSDAFTDPQLRAARHVLRQLFYDPYQIQAIAEHTQFDQHQVAAILDHAGNHQAIPPVAQAMQRLVDGTAEPRDHQLLRHEHLEHQEYVRRLHELTERREFLRQHLGESPEYLGEYEQIRTEGTLIELALQQAHEVAESQFPCTNLFNDPVAESFADLAPLPESQLPFTRVGIAAELDTSVPIVDTVLAAIVAVAEHPPVGALAADAWTAEFGAAVARRPEIELAPIAPATVARLIAAFAGQTQRSTLIACRALQRQLTAQQTADALPGGPTTADTVGLVIHQSLTQIRDLLRSGESAPLLLPFSRVGIAAHLATSEPIVRATLDAIVSVARRGAAPEAFAQAVVDQLTADHPDVEAASVRPLIDEFGAIAVRPALIGCLALLGRHSFEEIARIVPAGPNVELVAWSTLASLYARLDSRNAAWHVERAESGRSARKGELSTLTGIAGRLGASVDTANVRLALATASYLDGTEEHDLDFLRETLRRELASTEAIEPLLVALSKLPPDQRIVLHRVVGDVSAPATIEMCAETDNFLTPTEIQTRLGHVLSYLDQALPGAELPHTVDTDRSTNATDTDEIPGNPGIRPRGSSGPAGQRKDAGGQGPEGHGSAGSVGAEGTDPGAGVSVSAGYSDRGGHHFAGANESESGTTGRDADGDRSSRLTELSTPAGIAERLGVRVTAENVWSALATARYLEGTQASILDRLRTTVGQEMESPADIESLLVALSQLSRVQCIILYRIVGDGSAPHGIAVADETDNLLSVTEIERNLLDALTHLDRALPGAERPGQAAPGVLPADSPIRPQRTLSAFVANRRLQAVEAAEEARRRATSDAVTAIRQPHRTAQRWLDRALHDLALVEARATAGAVEPGELEQARLRVAAASEQVEDQRNRVDRIRELHDVPSYAQVLINTTQASAAAHDALLKRLAPRTSLGRPEVQPDLDGPWAGALNAEFAAAAAEEGEGAALLSGRHNNCVDASLAGIDIFDGLPARGARPAPIVLDASGRPSLITSADGPGGVEERLGGLWQTLTDHTAEVAAARAKRDEAVVALAAAAHTGAAVQDQLADLAIVAEDAYQQAVELAGVDAKNAMDTAAMILGRAGDRAAVLLTWDDGTTHVTTLFNRHDEVRHKDFLTNAPSSENPIFGLPAGGEHIVGVAVIAATAEREWLPVPDAPLSPYSTGLATGALRLNQLQHLPAEQRALILDRLTGGDPPPPVESADSRITRLFQRTDQLVRRVPTIKSMVRVGADKCRVTTLGGREMIVGAHVGATAPGTVAQVWRMDGGRIPVFDATIVPSPELVDWFFDRRLNAALDGEHTEMRFAGLLAYLAGLVDTLGNAGDQLDRAAESVRPLAGRLNRTAADIVTAALADGRSAVCSPNSVVGLAEGATRLVAAADVVAATDGHFGTPNTGAVAGALRDAAMALFEANEVLTAESALRRGLGIPNRLALADLMPITALELRGDQRENAPGDTLGRIARNRQIRQQVALTGLDQNPRRNLLRLSGHNDAADLAQSLGASRRYARLIALVVDRHWVRQVVSELADAIGVLAIEPVIGGTEAIDDLYRVLLRDGSSFTVAIEIDGAVSPARERADVVMHFPSAFDPVEARMELAYRLSRIVRLHTLAAQAGATLSEMADRWLAGLLGPDILGVHPLSDLVGTNPRPSPNDFGAPAWLWAFCETYRGAGWWQRRLLLRRFREWAHDNGLGADSLDYILKLATFAAAALDMGDLEGELVDFVERHNVARPTMRPLVEVGADRARLRQPRFDAAAVAELVSWLWPKLAEHGLGISYDGKTIEIIRLVNRSPVRSIPVKRADLDRLQVQQTNQGPGIAAVIIDEDIDWWRGQQKLLGAICATISPYVDTGGDGVPIDVRVSLELWREHFAQALERRQEALPLLKSDLRAFVRELSADTATDLTALPLELAAFVDAATSRGVFGFRLPVKNRASVDSQQQEILAKVRAGEPVPSRIPGWNRYIGAQILQWGPIGLIMGGVGLAFGNSEVLAGTAALLSLPLAVAQAIQTRRTDAGFESAHRASIEADAAQHARASARHAELVGQLVADEVRPILDALSITVPAVRHQRQDVDLWVNWSADPTSGRTSFKYQLIHTNLQLLLWGSLQALINSGLAAGKWSLALAMMLMIVMQFGTLAQADSTRGFFTVRRWNRQIADDTALEVEAQRVVDEQGARRLGGGMRARLEAMGVWLPDVDRPPGRRSIDVVANTSPRPHRKSRTKTYRENVPSRGLGWGVPYVASAGIFALVDPATAFANLCAGLGCAFVWPFFEVAFERALEQTSERLASQQTEHGRAHSRRAADIVIQDFIARFAQALNEARPDLVDLSTATSYVPGTLIDPGSMSPEELAKLLPPLRLLMTAGGGPGVGEAGLMSTGLLTPLGASVGNVQTLIAALIYTASTSGIGTLADTYKEGGIDGIQALTGVQTSYQRLLKIEQDKAAFAAVMDEFLNSILHALRGDGPALPRLRQEHEVSNWQAAARRYGQPAKPGDQPVLTNAGMHTLAAQLHVGGLTSVDLNGPEFADVDIVVLGPAGYQDFLDAHRRLSESRVINGRRTIIVGLGAFESPRLLVQVLLHELERIRQLGYFREHPEVNVDEHDEGLYQWTVAAESTVAILDAVEIGAPSSGRSFGEWRTITIAEDGVVRVIDPATGAARPLWLEKALERDYSRVPSALERTLGDVRWQSLASAKPGTVLRPAQCADVARIVLDRLAGAGEDAAAVLAMQLADGDVRMAQIRLDGDTDPEVQLRSVLTGGITAVDAMLVTPTGPVTFPDTARGTFNTEPFTAAYFADLAEVLEAAESPEDRAGRLAAGQLRVLLGMWEWPFGGVHVGGLGGVVKEHVPGLAELGFEPVVLSRHGFAGTGEPDGVTQVVENPLGVRAILVGLPPGTTRLTDLQRDFETWANRYGQATVNPCYDFLFENRWLPDVMALHDRIGTREIAMMAAAMGRPLIDHWHYSELNETLGQVHYPDRTNIMGSGEEVLRQFLAESERVQAADQIIAVAPAVAEALTFGHDLDPSRVRVIPNGGADLESWKRENIDVDPVQTRAVTIPALAVHTAMAELDQELRAAEELTGRTALLPGPVPIGADAPVAIRRATTEAAVARARHALHTFGSEQGNDEICAAWQRVELLAARAAQADAVAGTGLPADTKLIFFVGRLFWRKGIQELIRAINLVVADEPNAHVVIVGSGDYKPTLIDLQAELETVGDGQGHVLAWGHVHWLGWLSAADAAPTAAACDVETIQSWAEGAPLTANEGAVTEVAMIGTRAVPFIEHMVTGLIVEPGDHVALAEAIRTLLRDRELAAQLIAAAREKAYSDEYQWWYIVEQVAQIYRDAAERGRLPRKINAPYIPDSFNVFDVARISIAADDPASWALGPSGGTAEPAFKIDRRGAVWNVPLESGRVDLAVYYNGEQVTVDGHDVIGVDVKTGKGIPGHVFRFVQVDSGSRTSLVSVTDDEASDQGADATDEGPGNSSVQPKGQPTAAPEQAIAPQSSAESEDVLAVAADAADWLSGRSAAFGVAGSGGVAAVDLDRLVDTGYLERTIGNGGGRFQTLEESDDIAAADRAVQEMLRQAGHRSYAVIAQLLSDGTMRVTARKFNDPADPSVPDHERGAIHFNPRPAGHSAVTSVGFFVVNGEGAPQPFANLPRATTFNAELMSAPYFAALPGRGRVKADGTIPILQVAWEFPVIEGGLGVVLENLLPELARAGCEVTSLSRQRLVEAGEPVPVTEELSIDGVHAIVPALPAGAQYRADYLRNDVLWLKLVETVMGNALYDHMQRTGQRWPIVQGHDWVATVIAQTLKEAFGDDIKFVLHIHDVVVGRWLGSVRNPLVAQKFIQEWTRAQYADAVIVNSEHNKAMAAWVDEIPLDRITVIPNGADLSGQIVDRAAMDRSRALNDLGYPADTFLLFAWGRLMGIEPPLSEHLPVYDPKGVTYVIEAMPAFKVAFPNARLLIAGADFGGRQTLQAQIDRLVEQGRLNEDDVRLAGRISDEDRDRAKGAADLVVAGSPYEGFGLTVIEAGAARAPVVGTRVFASMENKVTGLIVPSMDPVALAISMIAAARNPNVTARWAENAFQQATSSTFRWPTIAGRTVEKVYRPILQAHGRPLRIGPPPAIPSNGNVFDIAEVSLAVADGDPTSWTLSHAAGSSEPSLEGRTLDRVEDGVAYWKVPLISGASVLHYRFHHGDETLVVNGRTDLVLEVDTGRGTPGYRVRHDTTDLGTTTTAERPEPLPAELPATTSWAVLNDAEIVAQGEAMAELLRLVPVPLPAGISCVEAVRFAYETAARTKQGLPPDTASLDEIDRRTAAEGRVVPSLTGGQEPLADAFYATSSAELDLSSNLAATRMTLGVLKAEGIRSIATTKAVIDQLYKADANHEASFVVQTTSYDPLTDSFVTHEWLIRRGRDGNIYYLDPHPLTQAARRDWLYLPGWEPGEDGVVAVQVRAVEPDPDNPGAVRVVPLPLRLLSTNDKRPVAQGIGPVGGGVGSPAIVPLVNEVRPYAWGSWTAIAELQGRPSPAPGPEAELWIGAHPGAPSQLPDGSTLDSRIAADPVGELGAAVVAEFGPTLPFLAKILAAAEPLSLQVHPSIAQARAGFAAENAVEAPLPADHPTRNYRDENHKPELICALTPFTALVGFRPEGTTQRLLDGLNVAALVRFQDMLSTEGLGPVVGALLRDGTPELVDAVVAACAVESDEFAAERALAMRLATKYPGDPGVVVALLLNLVTLAPGEALFLPAGNMHAYVEGVGVEVMANSDNVLRGGLTPKHIDVPELLNILDPSPMLPPVETPVRQSNGEWVYDTPAREFRLSRLDPGVVELDTVGPQVLIVLDGTARIRQGDTVLDLRKGESAYLSADRRPVTVEGDGTTYRVTTNLPSDATTLAAVAVPDADGVVRLGKGMVVALDTSDTVVSAGPGRLIATLGVTDLAVIDAPDALLISPCGREQEARDLLDVEHATPGTAKSTQTDSAGPMGSEVDETASAIGPAATRSVTDRELGAATFYSVIPAGGSGTRLWPMSRADRPKFLLNLGGDDRSLIQSTQVRLADLAGPGSTYVVTGGSHAAAVAGQLSELPSGNILAEPSPRDTLPAIALAAALIHHIDPDAVMGSFAADHLVSDAAAFHAAVQTAIVAAADGLLVTIGITPTGPATGFGYLRSGAELAGGACLLQEFVEKPPLEVARDYVAQGYLWNAGMFVWRVDAFLDEVARQQPQLKAGLDRIVTDWDTDRRDATLAEVWPTLPAVSVDVGVMEDAGRRGRVATVPADIGWNDVGDFDTLGTVLPADADGVVRLGDGSVVTLDTSGAVISAGSGRLVATVGVRDLVVIDTPDAVLVIPRERAQEVKGLLDAVRDAGRGDLAYAPTNATHATAMPLEKSPGQSTGGQVTEGDGSVSVAIDSLTDAANRPTDP